MAKTVVGSKRAPKRKAGAKEASAARKTRTPSKQATAKRIPAKKRAAPKRPAAARTAPKKTTRTTRLKTAAPAQLFTVSHLIEDGFKPDGLRPYARYRDLGIGKASGGLCQAHVIRFTPPCTDEVRKRHVHDVELQLVYVLKGWIKNEFDGHGEQLMQAGSCWLQPPQIKHTVLDYSDDCELLEVIVPAEFATVEV
jgi:hypothetical protein